MDRSNRRFVSSPLQEGSQHQQQIPLQPNWQQVQSHLQSQHRHHHHQHQPQLPLDANGEPIDPNQQSLRRLRHHLHLGGDGENASSHSWHAADGDMMREALIRHRQQQQQQPPPPQQQPRQQDLNILPQEEQRRNELAQEQRQLGLPLQHNAREAEPMRRRSYSNPIQFDSFGDPITSSNTEVEQVQQQQLQQQQQQRQQHQQQQQQQQLQHQHQQQQLQRQQQLQLLQQQQNANTFDSNFGVNSGYVEDSPRTWHAQDFGGADRMRVLFNEQRTRSNTIDTDMTPMPSPPRVTNSRFSVTRSPHHSNVAVVRANSDPIEPEDASDDIMSDLLGITSRSSPNIPRRTSPLGTQSAPQHNPSPLNNGNVHHQLHQLFHQSNNHVDHGHEFDEPPPQR